MIRQWLIMFFLSLLVGLLLESHDVAMLTATGSSYATMALEILIYAMLIMTVSAVIALVPRLVYWVMRKENPPEFIMLTWSMWVFVTLIVVLIYFSDESEKLNDSTKKLSAEEIYKNVSGSVYSLYNENSKNEIVATGGAVAVDQQYLATNCHIIDDADHFTVLINDKEKRGVLYSEHGDLCIISVPGETFKPVKLRPSREVNIGEEVYAIGNPDQFDKSISNGIISNKHHVHGVLLLQTNAAISPGSSGGGLFDHNGNLIGITQSISSDEGNQNINFALPTELINAAMLEPVIPDHSKENKKAASGGRAGDASDKIDILGYYGDDKVGLFRWQGACFIGVAGRDQADNVTSVAMFLPTEPKELFIFSRAANVAKVVYYIKMMVDNDDVTLVDSKSRIAFNKRTTPLLVFVINQSKQPIYDYAQDDSMVDELIKLTSFNVEFFNYRLNKEKLTFIQFGLNGFADALGEYYQSCIDKK